MSTNYATLGNATNQAALNQIQPALPSRPMERIRVEADRLARLACGVQSFIDRFHGNPHAEAGSAGGGGSAAPIQIGYRNEIDRLSANADMLDNMIQALGEIG